MGRVSSLVDRRMDGPQLAVAAPEKQTDMGATRVDMDISICICTRNRPTELARALESIGLSTVAPAEVVVSDDSDGDEVQRMLAERHPEVVYVKGPRLGLGANRNCAVSAATGDHVLFLDDDAMLGDTFLEMMEGCLRALEPGRRARTILTGVERQNGRSIAPNNQGFLGFQSRPYRAGHSLRTVVINAAVFPSALFADVRFDPQLIYGYDEVDVTTQAVAHGFEIVPCFEAINDHLPSQINRSEYRPFIDASRLYVTLKRRRWTEGSWLRGWSGFWLAVLHTYLAALKRRGLHGIGEAHRAVVQARVYYANFVRSADPPGRPS